MWNGTHMGGWFFGGYGMILWIVVIVVLLWLLIRLFQRSPGNQDAETGPSPHSTESARDILEKRYARGEITQDEFQRMKQDLAEK